MMLGRALQVDSVARAMELGKHAADYVSTTFVRPVKLEFEKVGRAMGGWMNE
jgi:hypothetical protein